MANADEKLLLWLNGWVGTVPAFDRFMQLVVSDYLVPVGITLTLLGMWFSGRSEAVRLRRQVGLFAALAAMGFASLGVYIVNAFYVRPRPFVDYGVALLFYRPTDSSFPSNPAAATFAIAAVVWAVDRRVGSFMFCAAALFAFARVYAGVHYPSDVVAGGLIGVVAACAALRLRDALEPIPSMVVKAARILCLA